MTRRRITTGEETDVHGRWRRVFVVTGRPGYCAAVKRRTNRRERQEGKQDARQQLTESEDTWPDRA